MIWLLTVFKELTEMIRATTSQNQLHLDAGGVADGFSPFTYVLITTPDCPSASLTNSADLHWDKHGFLGDKCGTLLLMLLLLLVFLVVGCFWWYFFLYGILVSPGKNTQPFPGLVSFSSYPPPHDGPSTSPAPASAPSPLPLPSGIAQDLMILVILLAVVGQITRFAIDKAFSGGFS